ncbi:MAG: MaoC family dehydratase [Rhizobiaceae bacterium]|nr:MaoC family dehydratase [Rhizobiaceae bacterium]
MDKPTLTFEEFKALAGQELGVSDWLLVDQERIDRFAECTGDRQWIHTDVERTRRESPFRQPIAHGYLTLSLVAALTPEIGMRPMNLQAAFNYGVENVRFLAPVRAGSRVRLRLTLISLEDSGPGKYLMRAHSIMEIEGEEQPALTAETLIMFFERRARRESPC